MAVLLVLFLTTGTANIANAQKWAYVDTEYILNQLTDYKAAQKELDQLAEKWQAEVDAKYSQIDKMYKDLVAEKVLLNAEQVKEREAEIVKIEREAKAFQQEKFGYEGELFKKREQLIKPIQDRVFEAIQTIATRENLDFIFDKSGDMLMLYTNAKYDKSDEVLGELGVTPLDERKNDPDSSEDNLPEED
ncbi:MAG: OmpH family outer membrane protein [Flavobacteriales bacterium]|nr:OmpH family outer membrane protein [Flavobacteriales bacterium]